VVGEEVEHFRPGQRRKHGRGQQGEDPRGGNVARPVWPADLAAARVLEHALSHLRRHDTRPAGHHLGTVRAGVAPADQDLGAERPLQALPRPV